MSSLIFKGVTLAGTLDVGNWGVNTSAGFDILPSRKKESGLRMTTEAVEISNVSPPQCSLSLQTYVVEEISTEATVLKIINYGLDYVGKIGSLYAGTTLISANAGLAGCQPIYDFKKGYGIKWNFVIIKKGGNMQFLNKLRNPSFDAMNNAAIEGWTATPNDGLISQVQMFGNEELGDGQFAVSLKSNSTGDQPLVEQTIAYTLSADSEAYEYTYFKFSVDAIYENLALTQATSILTLTMTSSAVTKANKSFTLVSGLQQRLSIMCAVKNVYVSGNDLKVTITAGGADDEIIYIDNASIEEVEL